MTREILSPLTRLWRGLIGAVVMLSTGLFAAGFAAAQEFHYIHGGNINDVFFVGNLGWTAEDGGRIRYSQDGGNTWLLAGVPDHVRGDLRGLFFLSPDMGWAVGEGGVVLQSVPLTNGQAWADVNANNRVTNSVTNVSTPCNTSEAELYDIFMTTPMDGWAVGLDGAVRRTANNWGAFSSPTTIPHKYTCVDDPYDAYKIHFFLDSGVSPTPAFSKGVIASEFGQVLTTDDGGDNWVTHLVDPNGAACPVPDGPNIEFWDLVFDSPLVHTSPGWIVGGVGNNNGYLFRTSSGGTDGTWTQSKCLNFLDPDDPATKLICGLSTGYGLAVLGTAPNPQAISGGYGSQILVHEPGFGNFDPCNCNSCGGPPFPYPCSVACGAPGTTSWVEKGVPLPSDNSKAAPAFFCATAITTTAACLGGMFGRIVRYENNVAIDKATVDFLRLNDGAFRSNGTDGCAIGQGHIIKVTTDGGASWDDGYNPAYIGSKSGNALKLADNSTYGAAVGSGGFVAHSSSAITPNSWSTTATSPTGNDLYDLAFVPGTTDFFVVGSGGLVDKTSNQGASWAGSMSIPSPTTEDLRAVSFASSTHGYVAGTGQSVYMTTTGGATWIQCTFTGGAPTGTLLDVVTWGNGDPAVVVGQGGDVYEKANGTRFTKVTGLGVTVALHDVEVLINGSNVDLRIGGDGGVALFRDAGAWSTPKSHTTYPIYKMAFQSSTQGRAIGRNFIVLSYN